jgi:hypothetical protein
MYAEDIIDIDFIAKMNELKSEVVIYNSQTDDMRRLQFNIENYNIKNVIQNQGIYYLQFNHTNNLLIYYNTCLYSSLIRTDKDLLLRPFDADH